MPHDKPEGAKLGWRLESTTYPYQSRWFGLRRDQVRLPNGQQIDYAYMEHPGSVFIVPLTAKQEIVLLKIYRYTIDDWCWEIPAGGMGDRIGEPPETVAVDELREEIGGVASRLSLLGRFYSNNGSAKIVAHFYLAYDVLCSEPPEREPMEVIDRVDAFSFTQIREMIKDGTLTDADSLFGILLAMHQLESR